MPNTTPTPRPRYFSFGLRTMFVVLTVVAILSGWTAANSHLAKQRDAFTLSLIDRKVSVRANLHGPALWPLSIIGRDKASRDYIELTEGLFTPADIEQIRFYYPDAVIYSVSGNARKLVEHSNRKGQITSMHDKSYRVSKTCLAVLQNSLDADWDGRRCNRQPMHCAGRGRECVRSYREAIRLPLRGLFRRRDHRSGHRRHW